MSWTFRYCVSGSLPAWSKSNCLDSHLIRCFIHSFVNMLSWKTNPWTKPYIAKRRAPREPGCACRAKRQLLADSSQAILIPKGHKEVTSRVTTLWEVLSGSSTVPLIELITHCPTGESMALHSLPETSFLAPCGELAAGRTLWDTSGFPAQRQALLEENYLTPGEENQFFSVWGKACPEARCQKNSKRVKMTVRVEWGIGNWKKGHVNWTLFSFYLLGGHTRQSSVVNPGSAFRNYS